LGSFLASSGTAFQGGNIGTTTGNGSAPGDPTVPLNDLGTGTYQGQEGGLYSNGTDVRSASLEATADKIASQIHPLDANGNVDLVKGKIVLISVGMSNTTLEFANAGGFMSQANADPSKSSQLVIVDGAQSGMAASDWANPNSVAWTILMTRLTAAGVTANQVQVAWVKEAERYPEYLGGFTPAAQKLQSDLEAIARNLTSKFSHMKIAYLSSRTHAFTDSGLNPEPYAFGSGYAVKWAIQDQINSKGNLNFDASKGPVVAPLLLWGPYLWANGQSARSDGFTWTINDVQGDLTHPSGSGISKVGQMLLAFFKTDPTATPWFLCKDTAGMAPTVTASANHTSGSTGMVVQFNASGIAAHGDTIASYVWTFDDGDFAYGATPTKTFYALGTYLVHLTVTDNLGNVTTQSLKITISGGNGSAIRTAVAAATPVAGGTAPGTIAPAADLVRTLGTVSTSDGFRMAAPTNWSAGSSFIQQPSVVYVPASLQMPSLTNAPASTDLASTRPPDWTAGLTADLQPELALV
jgi:PKD repeat protein